MIRRRLGSSLVSITIMCAVSLNFHKINLKMSKLGPMILMLMMGFCVMVYAQQQDQQLRDPQNMKVDPENTDCHILPKTFQSLTEALEAVENTRFYYDQSLKTTRRSGLMQARFVSCDFKTGYLVIRYDGSDQVYPDIDLELWEQFQQTPDIDGFYFDKIQNLPKVQNQ